MKAYIGITDSDWYEYLSAKPDIDEVNFWQPGGNKIFRTLSPGQPFLFKLHSPDDFVVGGGFFAHSNLLPLSLAWDAFGDKNGAVNLDEMRRRIGKYRRIATDAKEDYQIGCILLTQPFFFEKSAWVPVPEDWKKSIQQGKKYDLCEGYGKALWDEVNIRFKAKSDYRMIVQDMENRKGTPVLVTPRLGQGSFRIMVTETYEYKCAVTQERVLPALEAAHIRPFVKNGPHAVENGVLFRSDIHKIFDRGYVTISPDYRFEVSKKIKEDYENGRDYYAMHGKQICLPRDSHLQPGSEFIQWHNENVFLG